ncbi:unnamed protein product, partial [Allacma fusca]
QEFYRRTNISQHHSRTFYAFYFNTSLRYNFLDSVAHVK